MGLKHPKGHEDAGKGGATKAFHKGEIDILEQLFKDLASRSPGPSMDKDAFATFFQLPGIIGKLLFKVFDKDNNGTIDRGEFLSGLAQYYRGSMDEKLEMLFAMYDGHEKKSISKIELTTLLHSLVTPETALASTSKPLTPAAKEQPEDSKSPTIMLATNLRERKGNKERRASQKSHLSTDLNGTPRRISTGFERNRGVSRSLRLEEEAAYEKTENMVEDLVAECLKTCNAEASERVHLYEFKQWIAHNPKVKRILETLFYTNSWCVFPTKEGGEGGGGEEWRGTAAITTDEASGKFSHHHHQNRSMGSAMSLASISSHGSQVHPPPPHHHHHQAHQTNNRGRSSLSDQRQGSYAAEVGDDGVPSSSTPSINVTIGDLEKAAQCSLLDHKQIEPLWHFLTTMKTKVLRIADDNRPSQPPLELQPQNSVESTASIKTAATGNSIPMLLPPSAAAAAPPSPSAAIPAVAHRYQGYLFKLGAKTGGFRRRWCTVQNSFYEFKNRSDSTPSKVIYLEGYFFAKGDTSKPGYFSIKMTRNKSTSKWYFTKLESEQEAWVDALRRAGKSTPFEDCYNLETKIGKGRFSIVHRGVEVTTGQKVAVKIIEKKLCIREREREALRTEIAILKLVHHPNIIRTRDIFETGDNIYIVMDLMKAGDLFNWIIKFKIFPEYTVQSIVFQLLSAINYLHRRGIVHRDLKPENILCTNINDGLKVIISDFGLSKFVRPSELMKMPCGTLAYVAPEVLRNKGYTKAVDIWSIGVIFYLMLRGGLPFDGKSKADVVHRTLTSSVSFRHPRWKFVSPMACSLLLRFLMKDPDKRITVNEALANPWFDDFHPLIRPNCRAGLSCICL